MKILIILCLAAVLTGCSESPLDSKFALEFPPLPQDWETMLGSPHWQVEWVNDKGQKKSVVLANRGKVEINLAQTWTNAVIALPFWPEKNIRKEVFRPAGAIFPFDVKGRSLVLSWQGGVEAVLYYELAAAYKKENNATGSVPRLPQYFDWPRFRQLFEDTTVNDDFREDPWTADWKIIAERIVQSGFDKRRLVPEDRSSLAINVNSGPWVGTSPFSFPLFFEDAPVFPVRAVTDTWVSNEGLLRCNAQAWIFLEF